MVSPRQTRLGGIELIESSGDLPFDLSVSGENVHQISLHSAILKGYKIKVTSLDISNGQQISQHTLSSENEVTDEKSILFVSSNTAAPLLIWTDTSFKVIKVNILGTKHIASINIVNNRKEAIRGITVHAPRTTGSPQHFLVQYQSASSHWAEVYHVNAASGAVSKTYDLSELGGIGAFSCSTEGDQIYFTRHTDFEVTLLSSTSDAPIQSWPIRPKSHGGLADPQGVTHAVSEVASKGSLGFAVRSALTLPSGDWELVRNGDPVWLRSESIGGIVAAAWLELSLPESLAQALATETHSGILGAYTHRFRRHAKDVVTYLPGFIETLPEQVMGIFGGPKENEEDHSLDRDSFGFKKMVIAATERGRLAVLDTSKQGKVIWNIKAVDIAADQKWQVNEIRVRDSIATVHGIGGELLTVEALTGQILDYQPAKSSSSLKDLVPVLDAAGEQVNLAINKDGSIEVPAGKALEKGTVVTTRGDGNIARGWTLGPNAKPRLAWEFLPKAGEQIFSLTHRQGQDSVASIGKALGDRNVLYKYLNPNLVLITTIETAASRAAIYLLDSTSGEILYNAQHSGVDTARTIATTMTENWLAYTLYINPSTAATPSPVDTTPSPKGHQLIVSELFESALPNDRGPLGSTTNFSAISSPILLPAPHVISQAYLLPGPISHLTPTSTLQSITPRSLLAIVPHLHGILSIPRTIIDPRRPVGRDPTPAEAEEGLFRHSHLLDFEPKWMLTHQRDVFGLTNVITTPSLLESTSLVFAYGELDVFGTRTAPIGGFDILGKGFSRFQLVATVVGLAVGTGALAPMVSFPSSPFSQAFCVMKRERERETMANDSTGPQKTNRRYMAGLIRPFPPPSPNLSSPGIQIPKAPFREYLVRERGNLKT